MSSSNTFDAAYASQSKPKPATTLNDLYSDEAKSPAALTKFTKFSSLPEEICLDIWQLTLQHHRLIGVRLNRRGAGSTASYTSKNAMGNLISGGDYVVELRTKQRLSPLFQTCRQSRQAATEFYRVRLPYDSARAESPCIYFNPEFDFLDIDLQKNGLIIVDLLYDLKAYDPRGVGVLNLVVGTHEPHVISLPRKPSKPSASMNEWLSAFTQILSNLRRMVFHHRIRADTRIISSYDVPPYFNRSFPIFSFAESFDLLHEDPRPIEADLCRVSVGLDPCMFFSRWQQMERDLGVTQTRPTKYQYLITHAPGKSVRLNMDKTIPTRETADEFLRLEEKTWRRRWGDSFEDFGGQDIEPPECINKAVMPAFGFWLFPSEAFNQKPAPASGLASEYPDTYGIFEWNLKLVADLSKFRPQIGLFKFA